MKIAKKGRNYKKFKVLYQTRINLKNSPYLRLKLKNKKWFFLKFNNKFKFFPRTNRVNNLKFFYKNSLNIRRILTNQNCFIRASSLYKLYLKSKKGNPRYLHFLNLFESRLDICLFRIGLFSSPLVLRKFILENNVYLNGNLVNKPGILLKKNDLVQFKYANLNFYNYKIDI